jgi:hypothetical protein
MTKFREVQVEKVIFSDDSEFTGSYNDLKDTPENSVLSLTLLSTDWVNDGDDTFNQELTAPGVTVTSNIIVSHANTRDDYDYWTTYEIFALSQGAGTITFQSLTEPTEDIDVNVIKIN